MNDRPTVSVYFSFGINGDATHDCPYDLELTARELYQRRDEIMPVVARIYAQGVRADLDNFFDEKESGKYLIFGSDDRAHLLTDDEPVYIAFIDVDQQQAELDAQREAIRKLTD